MHIEVRCVNHRFQAENIVIIHHRGNFIIREIIDVEIYPGIVDADAKVWVIGLHNKEASAHINSAQHINTKTVARTVFREFPGHIFRPVAAANMVALGDIEHPDIQPFNDGLRVARL
ncbi:Uncharacterised protein [Klebsiella pneumoniae]|nr:Uncharacterised protein [Klebsiella pneumoniae]